MKNGPLRYAAIGLIVVGIIGLCFGLSVLEVWLKVKLVKLFW